MTIDKKIAELRKERNTRTEGQSHLILEIDIKLKLLYELKPEWDKMEKLIAIKDLWAEGVKEAIKERDEAIELIQRIVIAQRSNIPWPDNGNLANAIGDGQDFLIANEKKKGMD